MAPTIDSTPSVLTQHCSTLALSGATPRPAAEHGALSMERDNTNFCLSGKSKPFSNKLRDAATEKKSKDILSKLKPSSGKKDADPSKERPRTAVRQMPAPRARPRPSSATLTKSGHTATAKSRQTCEQRLTVFGSLSLRGADCGENVNLLEQSGWLIENWVCYQSCPPLD